MVKLTHEDLVEDGLREMRRFHEEYQDSGKGSEAVRTFIAKSFQDEPFLLRYLIGRKYRAKHAWETILSYAEARFEKYPEIFPDTIPSKQLLFNDNEPMFGVLKERDDKGRRICYFTAGAWDPKRCTLEELVIICRPVVEELILDDDCLNNGIVFVHDCAGMGMVHAKQYTFQAILRFLNIYWYSFPLKVKGVYIINVPSFLTYIYAMIKPFVPKKLKERVLLSKSNQKFLELHEILSPDILPRSLGGNLEANESNDSQFV